MSEYTLVNEPDTLCTDLSTHPLIGVDTEFMRESTYFAELSLLQISAGDKIYCVDPLAGNPMADFWEAATGRTWVVHSARQDIEVIYQASDRMPAAIFDTQVAAGLLGYAPQLGYAGLVAELFGTEIPKSHTRANWSKRPLAHELLVYAAEDVQYLLPAHELLTERLNQAGRLAWAEEDSLQLLDRSLYDIDTDQAIDRLKGARKLRGRRRAAAARLAAWRETEALRSNRPRQWIVKDAVLVELASQLPENLAALQEIDGLPGGIVRRLGGSLLKTIASTAGDDENYLPPGAPTESQKSLMKRMQHRVAECAADLGLNAETLASRRDLTAIIMGNDPTSRVLTGWRKGIIGEDLQGMR